MWSMLSLKWLWSFLSRCQWNAQKELRETNRELAALLEISQTATRSLETEKILDDTLNKSLEILDFDVGYIRTLDAEKKNLIVRVARGLSSPEFLSTTFPLDSPDPVVGKKFSKHRSLTSAAIFGRIRCFRPGPWKKKGLSP